MAPASAAEIAALVADGQRVTVGETINLGRMSNVLQLDETALLVTAQAGMTVAALEEFLAARGLTLGLPLGLAAARTVGAVLAAPHPDEATPRTGPLTGQCVAVGIVLADGTVCSTRVAPKKAVGPDLMHTFIGSRGTLGILTHATFRVLRRGDARHQAAFSLPNLGAALSVARALIVKGARPAELTVLCHPPSVLITVEGTASLAEAERALCASLCVAVGGAPVPHVAPRPLDAPQVAVSLEDVTSERPSPLARVTGWHARGAAICDPAATATLPPVPPLWRSIKRALDVEALFPDWPT